MCFALTKAPLMLARIEAKFLVAGSLNNHTAARVR